MPLLTYMITEIFQVSFVLLIPPKLMQEIIEALIAIVVRTTKTIKGE